MIVDVDCGNTRIKWRFAGEVQARYFNVTDKLPEQWARLPKGSRMRVSSVVTQEKAGAFYQRLVELGSVSVEVAVVQSSFAGLSVAYREVSTLGVDRWLAMLAARHRCPAADCVIIHAGTALVADFLCATGQHLGGYIVGGWQSSLRTLGDAAPALGGAVDRVMGLGRRQPGTTTLEGIESGLSLLFGGFLRELKYSAAEHLQSPAWLFAGGDAEKMFGVYERLNESCLSGGHSGGRAELAPGLVLDGLAIALP